MNFLSDVITYIRRIIKSPSNTDISDALLIDYINRFWIMDVDARMQLFDLKTKYSFQTIPGVDQYNMPLYSIQSETPDDPNAQNIGMYPVYQGFLEPVYVNGVRIAFQTQKSIFFDVFPNIVQNPLIVGVGDGGAGPYDLQIPLLGNFTNPQNPPLQGILRGHVDIAGIIATGLNVDPPLATANALPLTGYAFNPDIPVTSVNSAVFFNSLDATGNNVVIQDSGQFLPIDVNYGLLMQPGKAPFGNLPLGTNEYSTTSNTINYFTGLAQGVTFPVAIPSGNNIYAQCYFFQNGLPRMMLFNNNVITLRVPPAFSYRVELDAYLTPAAFFSTDNALPFAYMAEYIARGAARKILSDTGDIEQLQFYEPLFREQEILVWKRSQRQFTSTRTQTIYSQGMNQGFGGVGYNGFGSNS